MLLKQIFRIALSTLFIIVISSPTHAQNSCSVPSLGTAVWGIFGKDPSNTVVRGGHVSQNSGDKSRIDWIGCSNCQTRFPNCSLYRDERTARSVAAKMDREHLSTGEAVTGAVVLGGAALLFCAFQPDQCSK